MSEKTEQPTPKKLRDARKKGQVAKSKEVASAAILTVIFFILWFGWGYFMFHFKELILLPSRYYDFPFKDALNEVLMGVIVEIMSLSLPIVMAAMVVAVLAYMFQVGVLFALESIKPDITKLNPAQGIKKIFSLNNLIELLKSIFKITFLSILIFLVIRDAIDMLLKIPLIGLPAVLPVLSILLKRVAVYTIFAFLVVGVVDFFLQHYQHIKKLKMTKDEVKREYKEMEGDPIIKGKRKQLHKELVMSDTVEKTKKAGVLVTNPTKLAIALYYNKDETQLPVVLAKGEGLLAKRMVEIAKENDIPIMQDIPLAQALYEHAQVEQYIPSELIKPVAEVLKWVQELEKSGLSV